MDGAVPWLKLFATWVVVFLYSETEQGFMQVMPMVLAFLLALKLLLACVSFRVSLQRRLIAPSAVLNYLGLWAFLVAAWLALIVVLFHPDAHLFLPLSLAVILLVPLARVGFARSPWPKAATLDRGTPIQDSKRLETLTP